MHELGLLKDMVRTLNKVADEQKISHISEITIEIGEASGAMPELFEEVFPYFQEQSELLKDAKMNFTSVKSRGLCTNCNAIFDVMKFEGECPRCGSYEKKMLSGTDVTIKNFVGE